MPGRASQILTFDSFKINLSYSMFLWSFPSFDFFC
jgi:hypothetical protein